MTGNLKTLGLALGVVLALSAMAASAASAQQGKLTSDGPVTLTGVDTGKGTNFLEAFGIKVECPETLVTGHKYNETPHTMLSNGATTFTVTPHYKAKTSEGKINCKTGLFPVTYDMNGCDYVLHLGGKGAEDTYAVTVDVVCPPGNEIKVTIFTTEADDPLTPFCILDIKPQAGLVGATIKDTTNGTMDLIGSMVGVHVTRTKIGAGHDVLCPNNTTTTTGLRAFDTLLTGHNNMGALTPISLTN